MKTLPLFLALVCVNLLVPPLASAQSSDKMPHIGFLAWDAASCRSEAFMTGLRELGHDEDRNVVIDCHHAGGRHEGLAPAAAESVRRRPDVIVAITHDYAEAARRVTQDIPIVMIVGGDPVAAGLVASLARPGGNITGVGHFSPELNAKRLELLKEVSPRIRRVAVLVFSPDKTSDLGQFNLRDTAQAAKTLGLELRVVDVDDGEKLDRAFDAIVSARADAVYVLPNRLFAVRMQRIADLAAWHQLPTIHFYEKYPEVGGLMAYGVDFQAVHRRAAIYVDKILKGANPAELPIEQATRFELVINLETARNLGLKVPQALLLRADKVIR
jgi:putative ABC transport system substrate-binding protein